MRETRAAAARTPDPRVGRAGECRLRRPPRTIRDVWRTGRGRRLDRLPVAEARSFLSGAARSVRRLLHLDSGARRGQDTTTSTGRLRPPSAARPSDSSARRSDARPDRMGQVGRRRPRQLVRRGRGVPASHDLGRSEADAWRDVADQRIRPHDTIRYDGASSRRDRTQRHSALSAPSHARSRPGSVRGRTGHGPSRRRGRDRHQLQPPEPAGRAGVQARDEGVARRCGVLGRHEHARAGRYARYPRYAFPSAPGQAPKSAASTSRPSRSTCSHLSRRGRRASTLRGRFCVPPIFPWPTPGTWHPEEITGGLSPATGTPRSARPR